MAANLSMETATRIWNAHREITVGENLRDEMKKALETGEDPNPRDGFGRRRNLQIGVPSGDNAHRLFDVEPSLAIHIIDAHIASKQAELAKASIAARIELGAE